jgi:hypothetical protein
MRRRGKHVAVLAAVLGVGSLAWAIPAAAGTGGVHRAAGGSTVSAGAPGGAARSSSRALAGPRVARVFLSYTPPVLVRAGEPVIIPVDAACVTASGASCTAVVSLSARGGDSGWTRASAPAGRSVRFDVTAAAARAASAGGGTGQVAFTISARAASGGASASLGSPAAPLRFLVTDRMPVVHVPALPYGDPARGSTVAYLPWGSGARAAGLTLGNESETLGPPSFAVGSGDVVDILDGLHGRLAVFDRGRQVASVPVGRVSPDGDVAISPRGDAFVSSSLGGDVDRPISLREIAREGRGAGPALVVGHGIPERLDAASGRPWMQVLPEDEWRAAAPAGGTLSLGRPMAGGTALVSVVRTGSVHLALATRRGVSNAVELAFDANLGELALAEPYGADGYVVVVHVARGGIHPADQYQAVVVRNGGVSSTFAIARFDYARCAPLSRFRLGPDGALYQLASFPDGVRVVRYDLGGDA